MHGALFITSVSGIVVSIAAFQAVDPGSIPGNGIFSHYFIPWKTIQFILHIGSC